MKASYVLFFSRYDRLLALVFFFTPLTYSDTFVSTARVYTTTLSLILTRDTKSLYFQPKPTTTKKTWPNHTCIKRKLTIIASASGLHGNFRYSAKEECDCKKKAAHFEWEMFACTITEMTGKKVWIELKIGCEKKIVSLFSHNSPAMAKQTIRAICFL